MFVTIILEVKKNVWSLNVFPFCLIVSLVLSLVFFKACCFHTCGSFDVYDYQVGISDETTASVLILG